MRSQGQIGTNLILGQDAAPSQESLVCGGTLRVGLLAFYAVVVTEQWIALIAVLVAALGISALLFWLYW
jgi:hypothetical protein